MQNIHGGTSLMSAAYQGHEACVQALLRAKADTELVDCDGHTALLWAESQGHTTVTKLLRQHASCLSLGLDNITLCAGLTLDAWRLWVVLCGAISVVLGVIAVARADAAVEEELLAEKAMEQAKAQARSKRSKRKKKAGRTAAAGDESSVKWNQFIEAVAAQRRRRLTRWSER